MASGNEGLPHGIVPDVQDTPYRAGYTEVVAALGKVSGLGGTAELV